jgi:hypothetical protein
MPHYSMFPPTDSLPVTPPTDGRVTLEIPCHRCGSLGSHIEGPGVGPHRAKLVCTDCGHFIRWLTSHPPEERAASRQRYQQQWLAQQPATPKQLAYLGALGHQGPAPENRLVASELLETLLRAQRKGTP